jgi:flotillin
MNFMPLGAVPPIVAGIAGGVTLLIFFVVVVLFVRTVLVLCPPNQVLVISGFGKRKPTYVLGGIGFRIPGLQRVDRMSLTLMEVPIAVRNAYSRGGIAMNLEAIANVKISSDTLVIGNAIERFLNRDVSEVRRVSKETLEGHLRGVVATLTPEQVNEDRLSFAENLTRESEEDLKKLGLHLDTLKILHVSDELGYLDATGRKAIAAVLREAEIAESDAKRNAEKSEAENKGRATVTRANVDTKIVQMQNDLRRIRAEMDSKVKSEEEITSAAAREARATAEQELQIVRAELETIRLQVETVLPAEADRVAREYLARGEAAVLRERGIAVATALELLYAAWVKAGPAAKQIALIQDLEKIFGAASEGVSKLKIDSITVIDNGAGDTLPNYIKAYPEMLHAIFRAVDQAVGIDIPGSVSGTEVAK